MTTTSPILIVGALRSGTTLFRLMLGCHSHIGYAKESEFGFDELGDEGFPPIEGFHARLRTHRQFIDRGFTVDPSLSYPDLVRDFMRQARESDGKPEVAAVIHSAFHRAPELWPDARFIHMLRDPRDVANSCAQIGWAGNAYYGVDKWLTAERRWDALTAVVPPERRFEVRYEQLVTAPETTLGSVCDFLKLPYEPGMLDYPATSTYAAPNPRLITQWRTRMAPREAARIDAKCGDLLTTRGYPASTPDPVTVSLPERAMLWLDHRSSRARQSIDKYGPALWTLQHVARVLPGEALRQQVKLWQNDVDRRNLK